MQELNRDGPSYTVDTLDYYGPQADEILLIVGSDALAAFERWKDPEGILERAGLAVAGRPGFGVSEAMRHFPPNWHRYVTVFDARPIDCSFP